MARPKKETYTAEEVELITHLVAVGSFGGTNNMLLNSGAQPSGEVGAIIMGLAGVVNNSTSKVQELVKSLQLNEARLAHLQGIADGALK